MILLRKISAIISLSFYASLACAKVMGIDAIVGIPDFIGGELRWYPKDILQLGVGYGVIPKDIVPQNYYAFEPMEVPIASTNNTSTQNVSVTDIKYDFDAITGFIRLYPTNNHWFTQLKYAYAYGHANLSLGLPTEGVSLPDIHIQLPSIIPATGKVTIYQQVLGLALGYQWTFSNSTFIEISAGAGYLFPIQTASEFDLSVDMGLALLGLSSAELNQQVDALVKQEYPLHAFAPIVSIAIGFEL